MKATKTFISAEAALAAILLLCGCGTSGDPVLPQNSDAPPAPVSGVSADGNSTYQSNAPRGSENVRFLYDIPQTEQQPVGIYNCQYADISEEKFLALFSQTPECDKKTFAETKRQISEYKNGKESGLIAYTDGVLQSAGCHTAQGLNYMAVEDGNDDSDTTTEFNFISRADLSKKIKSLMRDLFGIDVQVSINAVTADRFASDVDEHIKAAAALSDNPPSAEKYGTPADIYVISFVQTIDNIPFDGGFGNAVYTSEGLEYFHINAPMKIDSSANASADFITLDGAEKLLKEKYELLLLDEPETFTKAELTYAHSEGTLTPVWKFTAASGSETTFNAYTGKEVVWGIPGEGA